MRPLRSLPWAAVHRGSDQVPGCPEAAAILLRSAGLRVRFVGGHERWSISEALARRPALLVQPGGGELGAAWSEVHPHREAVRSYVGSGGRYLGLCLGGYLAGHTPGYALLSGDTDQLSARPDSPLRHSGPTIVDVEWEGTARRLYAQDPPVFVLDPVREGTPPPRATVLARYANDDPAAVVCDFGRGRVAVVGPHPEAQDDWFTDVGMAPLRPSGFELGLKLLARLMSA